MQCTDRARSKDSNMHSEQESLKCSMPMLLPVTHLLAGFKKAQRASLNQFLVIPGNQLTAMAFPFFFWPAAMAPPGVGDRWYRFLS